MDEQVFAIPTAELWGLISYKEKGLITGNSEVLKGMVQNGFFCKRTTLEEDTSYKQIIPYAIISHKESFYLFKRTSKQTEKRLHNKFSLGVGGHINPGNSLEPEEQFLSSELRRELFEELKLVNACILEDIEFVGFINDDTIPVGRAHIGLLYNVHVSDKDVYINEKDKMTGDWVEKSGLADFYDGMETWSKVTIDYYIS